MPRRRIYLDEMANLIRAGRSYSSIISGLGVQDESIRRAVSRTKKKSAAFQELKRDIELLVRHREQYHAERRDVLMTKRGNRRRGWTR